MVAQPAVLTLARLVCEFIGPSSRDRKSTRLNPSHSQISYAVFCLKKKKIRSRPRTHGGQLHYLQTRGLSLLSGLHPFSGAVLSRKSPTALLQLIQLACLAQNDHAA